ncbi:hypothetical protein B0H19DRAFT_1071179 [Mycena capillaripes]|nr:hypothetical protein B0H19DRAFT_1071179 [Mycena capillaripes]
MAKTCFANECCRPTAVRLQSSSEALYGGPMSQDLSLAAWKSGGTSWMEAEHCTHRGWIEWRNRGKRLVRSFASAEFSVSLPPGHELASSEWHKYRYWSDFIRTHHSVLGLLALCEILDPPGLLGVFPGLDECLEGSSTTPKQRYTAKVPARCLQLE